MTHHVPPSACPGCGTPNDAATASDGSGDGPDPGDPGVCIRCGTLGTYEADGTIRRPTAAELAGFLADPQVRRVIAAINQMYAFPRPRPG